MHDYSFATMLESTHRFLGGGTLIVAPLAYKQRLPVPPPPARSPVTIGGRVTGAKSYHHVYQEGAEKHQHRPLHVSLDLSSRANCQQLSEVVCFRYQLSRPNKLKQMSAGARVSSATADALESIEQTLNLCHNNSDIDI